MKEKLKQFWPLFLIIAVIAIFVIIILARPQAILFYGDTCPHCQNVENYLAANPSTKKFRRLEVYRNQTNNQLLLDKADKCGITGNNVGVPFLYDNGRCLAGQDQIINWLKE